jgi:hypothetical protein
MERLQKIAMYILFEAVPIGTFRLGFSSYSWTTVRTRTKTGAADLGPSTVGVCTLKQNCIKLCDAGLS